MRIRRILHAGRMTADLYEVDVEFAPSDELGEAETAELIAELEREGARAEILERHPASGALPLVAIVALIGVSASTVAGLAVTVAFIYRIFKCGVLIDMTGKKPRVKKERQLPRGSLLLLYADGRQEYREAASTEQITTLLRKVLGRGAGGG
jgi:hypothetical protein